MSIEQALQERSESKCELCSSGENLAVYEVPPTSDGSEAESVLICETCREQVEDADKVDANHWRCLNESMWSDVPAVQVMAWRMLDQLKAEGWPQNLLDMLDLDDKTMEWAHAMESDEDTVKHIDNNGTVLQAGDTVTLIKDLPVKGGGFTAKRGTVVKDIRLVESNAAHIEGRVSGQHIVILTKFVKKSG